MGRVGRGAVGRSEIDRDENVRGEMGRTEVNLIFVPVYMARPPPLLLLQWEPSVSLIFLCKRLPPASLPVHRQYIHSPVAKFTGQTPRTGRLRLLAHKYFTD